MEIKQLNNPFVAIKKDGEEKFAIAIGNNVVTQPIYTEEEAEDECKKITPFVLNTICFFAEMVMKSANNKVIENE